MGFDFGANGSRTMVLVYNSNNPEDLHDRFGGVEGSAYFIGGVGVNFQANRDIVLAPIRTGVGAAPGRQCRLPEVFRQTQVESVLIGATTPRGVTLLPLFPRFK